VELGLQLGGYNSRAGAGSFFFFFPPQLNYLHMRNICSKTFQPRVNVLNLPNYSTFTAYEKHMQSMNFVLLCRSAVRATFDDSGGCEVRYSSSAYAKLMLYIPLPLAPATIFLRRLLERESKKDFSKAYAMHKLSSLLAYAQHMRASSLTSNSFSHADISSARFSAVMLSSFIDVSMSSVDAAHMHS
jgi:hypothetical protein